uniref:Ig-like domain-containing protein n=1 Tax=Callithrix jacchus TaxID=9483 RepID=A0A5F4WFV4_CALJA
MKGSFQLTSVSRLTIEADGICGQFKKPQCFGGKEEILDNRSRFLGLQVPAGRTMKTLTGSSFLFLWLQLDCMSSGQDMKQSLFLSVREGDSVVINCTYTDSSSSYLYWYKQDPGASLQLLAYILSNTDTKQDQRLTVQLDKKNKHLSLQIAETQTGDSAIYSCAESTHCFSGTCILYPNLCLGPKPHSVSFGTNL